MVRMSSGCGRHYLTVQSTSVDILLSKNKVDGVGIVIAAIIYDLKEDRISVSIINEVISGFWLV
jgi:hypothetical protein